MHRKGCEGANDGSLGAGWSSWSRNNFLSSFMHMSYQNIFYDSTRRWWDLRTENSKNQGCWVATFPGAISKFTGATYYKTWHNPSRIHLRCSIMRSCSNLERRRSGETVPGLPGCFLGWGKYMYLCILRRVPVECVTFATSHTLCRVAASITTISLRYLYSWTAATQ